MTKEPAGVLFPLMNNQQGNTINSFKDAIAYVAGSLGSYNAIARLCGVTAVTIHKWRRAGHLPRTDYTGETCYGEIIAGAIGEPDLVARLRPPLARRE